jgi:hypothetical protein
MEQLDVYNVLVFGTLWKGAPCKLLKKMSLYLDKMKINVSILREKPEIM